MIPAADTAASDAGVVIEGHCLCRAVTLRAWAFEPRVGACHCRMCQRWSGGLFLSFVASGIEFDGPVVRYRSSDFAERAFCAVCGSNLWMHDMGSKSWELMPGLFDAARDWPLSSEIYTDRALAAIHLAGAHRRASRAEYESANAFVEGDQP
jgi:hypothetical protein